MADEEFICNSCGKTLSVKNGILQEDALIIRKEWGYFSHRDMEIHEIILCEKCYDRWVSELRIPARVLQKNEAM